MSAVARPVKQSGLSSTSALHRQTRRFAGRAGITLLAVTVVSIFLMPLAYMFSTAFKIEGQLSDPHAPLWPAVEERFVYEGKEYDVYDVPTPDGQVHAWALIEPHRESSTFIDPANVAAGPIEWEGRARTLEKHWTFHLNFDNFRLAWDRIAFPRLFFNTFAIAALSTLGAVLSAICVAYGFSRFRFPGRNGLFLVMIATIILPFQVTLIPSYAVYLALGWVGTWWPLIVPHFFSNAYNVFLLRQYFLSIPRELDEAAMIDGAGPVRILRSVIVPQAVPAIVAVTLFHFFWAWNEYFLPLIYLQGEPDAQPLAVGLARFNALY